MYRITKPEGFGKIEIEETPRPAPGPRDVLVRTRVSLISRGSEILRRYMHEEAIDPAIMGYSVAGVVEEVGSEAANRFRPGDRVMAVSPHAEFVLPDIDRMDGSQVWPLPDDLSFEEGAFLPLSCGAVSWAEIAEIGPGDVVVVLGQGLVGNLVMQATGRYAPGQRIAVDMIQSRCDLAKSLGADKVINGAECDPVQTVLDATDGRGADVVIDCVGGRGGLKSFAQALEMSRRGGTIHLIGLYHGEPLPLDAGKIQGKKLLGGYYGTQSRAEMQARAVDALQSGQIRVQPLISHRFPFTRAQDAYDLLYERLGEAMGVLLLWDEVL